MSVSSRDFFEKGFSFYHQGKFYRYSSSIDDSQTLKPLPDSVTVRGFTYINVGIMHRDTSSGKVIYQTIS
jgi:hypothetical protein